MRGLRPGLQILDRRPFTPLRHRLGIDAQFPTQRRERSLRSLYCCSDGLRRRGAPMTYLSHMASFHSNEWITPSNCGIKQLESVPEGNIAYDTPNRQHGWASRAPWPPLAQPTALPIRRTFQSALSRASRPLRKQTDAAHRQYDGRHSSLWIMSRSPGCDRKYSVPTPDRLQLPAGRPQPQGPRPWYPSSSRALSARRGPGPARRVSG